MWEYKVVPILMALYSEGYPFNAAKSKPINKLGEDGWELIEIIKVSIGENVAYFKRKIDA